jgi:hypothetical protein
VSKTDSVDLDYKTIFTICDCGETSGTFIETGSGPLCVACYHGKRECSE